MCVSGCVFMCFSQSIGGGWASGPFMWRELEVEESGRRSMLVMELATSFASLLIINV